MSLSRRKWFATLLRPLNPRSGEDDLATASPTSEKNMVAVVKGRDCLAYRHLSCSTCHERCPITGAFTVSEGRPTVVADVCTGCGICYDVCPAPSNAILMIPRRTK